MFRKSIVTRVLALGVAAFTFTSCEEVTDALSQGDTVAALKEALGVGVNVAVDRLHSEGYFEDAATRIGLPQEAVSAFTAIKALQNIQGANVVLENVGLGSDLQDNLITLFNEAATDAAPKAVSVFSSAITNMSVQDGEAILFGGSGAATTYLKDNTYTDLQGAFHDPIVNSMNKVNIAGLTATDAWSKFALGNNTLAKNINSYKNSSNIIQSSAYKAVYAALPAEAKVAVDNIGEVDGDISNYITGKALDGLFLRVSQKEDDIRTNAAARTSDLLKRVFGRLDE